MDVITAICAIVGVVLALGSISYTAYKKWWHHKNPRIDPDFLRFDESNKPKDVPWWF